MAKIYGLFGAMTGKLADTVMSVRNGEQIARKYQPIVFNPSTPAQVAQRAKLKLLSQLSAVLAPVIAIPRQGAVSARNMFTKVNFPFMSYENDEASVQFDKIQLTKSDVFMMQPVAAVTGAGVTVNIADGADLDVNRVAYVALRRGDDGKVRYVGSQVIEKADDPTFEATFTNMPSGTPAVGNIAVYAYGVRENTENARAAFANMEWKDAESIAGLVVSRTLLERDLTLTETRMAVVSVN